ncbi:ADP-ribosylation factor family protein [Oesophagostomum dentatum]|uniref:ADP-ribosylation factor family protein n=1 Tax=Oesophagostomum dentatum TaxID=61180 RepID=A0A0B1SSZ8_OESDE|nr:ADP-ribosylation factor family protein [Oesophagostomum dentatum]
MGAVFSKIRYWLLGPIFCRILMLGLHNSGKSTVLCKLKSGDVEAVTRTAGFNVETVKYRDVAFTIWDIGGNQRVRHIWKHYYVNVKAVIFVVDSSDHKQITEALEEVLDLMEVPELKGTTLLVLANKQDLEGCMNSEEITAELKLHSIKDREWHVQPSSGISGEGLMSAIEWLYLKVTS